MNPYKIEPPFVISFSGGRTSGYMLRKILDAYDGVLPADGYVIFANTGKEHFKTLDFVHQIETEWTKIIWIEYRHRPQNFEIVSSPSLCKNENLNHHKIIPFRINKLNQVEELVDYSINWQISTDNSRKLSNSATFKNNSVSSESNPSKKSL